jgi:hypothetical protein
MNVIALGGSAHAAAVGPEVTIETDDDASFPKEYDVVGRLEPNSVLRVHVVRFESFTRAVAEQCATNEAVPCGNPIPVQFDEDGNARFQYLITDAFLGSQPAGACRGNAAPCTLVVRALGSQQRAEIQTIFIDPTPPAGRIGVTPSSGLSVGGATVTVEVHDYPPGVHVQAMLCAVPDSIGSRCGEPGPSAPLVVGPDGSGRTRLVLKPGRVGSQSARCSRTDRCGISVASDAVFTRAPVVPISFAGPPGADYDPTRVALGLGVALLLVGAAIGLIRRTDWSAVGEAAAPEIDDAEYADLDAIIAALPPEEDTVVSGR